MLKARVLIFFAAILISLYILFKYKEKHNESENIFYNYTTTSNEYKSKDNLIFTNKIDTKNTIIQEYLALINFYNHIDFNEKFNKTYNSLMQHEKIEEEVSKLLLDFSYNELNFKEKQSYARVFSIKILKKIAEDGNPKPLLNTITLLSKKIKKNGIFVKGIDRDLEDLIISYIELFETENFIENFDIHIKKLNFDKHNYSKELHEIFDNTIYYKLTEDKVNREKIKLLLNRYFDN